MGCPAGGDGVSVADIFPLDATYFRTPLGVLPVSATTSAFAIAVAVAFFQGQAFDIYPKTPYNQEWGLRPSITTNILLSLRIKILGKLLKFVCVNVTSMTMSSVAFPTLLIMSIASSTFPYWAKRSPILFFCYFYGQTMNCHFCSSDVHVLRLEPKFFAVKILPVNYLDPCSVANRTSHIALERRLNKFGSNMQAFRVSSIVSLLTPINFWLYMSVVSGEIILVFTGSKASGIVMNSFPLSISLYIF